MRIKYRDCDFVVTEELKELLPGEHYLYLVQKENLTTWDVLSHLSRHFHVSPKLLSFCGLKDRNAVAHQYMSCPKLLAEDYRTARFTLKLAGRVNHPLGASDILRNKFEIVVRDLAPEKTADFGRGIEEVKAYGLSNYFDEQRFESHLGADDFVARRLMLGHYEGALKLLIAHPLKLDSAELKQFKALSRECWGEWSKLAHLAPRKYQRIFRQLEKEPGAFEKVFRFLDHNHLEFLVAAFQSYLWNEVAGRFIRLVAKDGFDFHYFLGHFYFYREISEQYYDFQIPIINVKTEIVQPMIREIYDDVLRDVGMGQSQLRLKPPLRIRVKSFARSLVIRPEFSKVEVIDDKYFRGRRALVLWFSLPPGSYATLVIKRMMGEKKKAEERSKKQQEKWLNSQEKKVSGVRNEKSKM